MKKVLYILIAGAMMFGACAKEEVDEAINGGVMQDTIVNPTGGDTQDTIIGPGGGSQDTTVTPTPSAIDGMLPGEFTVSPTIKVHFSKGNLQYTTTGSHATAEGNKPGKWRFAEHQYDYVGSPSQFGAEDHGNLAPGNVSGSDNAYISSTYTGWIDLFGWGTSGYHNPVDEYNISYFPYSSRSEYEGDVYARHGHGYGPSTNQANKNLTGDNANYDWGIYNAISNGGNAVGQWRTLTGLEWYYLLERRIGASSLSGFANVCGTNGVVLLPDAWVAPKECSFKAGVEEGFRTNVYLEEQWRKMEESGAVFLPAAGGRAGTKVRFVGAMGYYWSSTTDDEHGEAYNFNFGSEGAEVTGTERRYFGHSVRLVRQ